MKFKELYLHNINEIIEHENYTQFLRFPNSLKPYLESPGLVNEVLQGSEIRFKINGPVSITLVSLSNPILISVYYGDFQAKQTHIIYDKPTTIELEQPFSDEWLETAKNKSTMFDPNLVRILLNEKVAFCNIEGSFSYPDNSMMPKTKMLSYGTSITQGRSSSYADITYPLLFGRHINADVDNLAMSGSCLIEPKYVDFILSKQYDYITLCLSTNMLGKGYDVKVFEQRINYLFEQIKLTNPNATVIILNLLTSYRDLDLIKMNVENTTNRVIYRKTMLNAASKYDNFHIIDGTKLLSPNNLTNDLLHPGHYGMIEIARNLANYYDKNIK